MRRDRGRGETICEAVLDGAKHALVHGDEDVCWALHEVGERPDHAGNGAPLGPEGKRASRPERAQCIGLAYMRLFTGGVSSAPGDGVSGSKFSHLHPGQWQRCVLCTTREWPHLHGAARSEGIIIKRNLARASSVAM